MESKHVRVTSDSDLSHVHHVNETYIPIGRFRVAVFGEALPSPRVRQALGVLLLAQKQGGVIREGPRGSSTRLGRQKPFGHDQVKFYQHALILNANLSALSRIYSLSSNSCRPRTPFNDLSSRLRSFPAGNFFHVHSRLSSCFGASIVRAISHQRRRWLQYRFPLIICPPQVGIGYL
jgi:hypothetical protein